jgi:hypothetical protein
MTMRDQLDDGCRLPGHLPFLTLFAVSAPSGHICSTSLPDGEMCRIAVEIKDFSYYFA